jgi:hypothetical protein
MRKCTVGVLRWSVVFFIAWLLWFARYHCNTFLIWFPCLMNTRKLLCIDCWRYSSNISFCWSLTSYIYIYIYMIVLKLDSILINSFYFWDWDSIVVCWTYASESVASASNIVQNFTCSEFLPSPESCHSESNVAIRVQNLFLYFISESTLIIYTFNKQLVYKIVLSYVMLSSILLR